MAATLVEFVFLMSTCAVCSCVKLVPGVAPADAAAVPGAGVAGIEAAGLLRAPGADCVGAGTGAEVAVVVGAPVAADDGPASATVFFGACCATPLFGADIASLGCGLRVCVSCQRDRSELNLQQRREPPIHCGAHAGSLNNELISKPLRRRAQAKQRQVGIGAASDGS